MSNLSIAEKIAEMNKQADQYCEFVADKVIDIQNDLADGDVTVIQEKGLILVLDQYAAGDKWLVEVWGPFFQNRVFPQEGLLDILKTHIQQFPAEVNFFYAYGNHALTDWLAQQSSSFTKQTIWQMQPLAMPETDLRLALYDQLLTNKQEASELLALHHQMFSGNAVTDVSPEHPLFLAYKNEQLCGYALAENQADGARLLYVGVDPRYRKQSVATSLMAYLWQTLHQSKADRAITLVQSEKAAAAGQLYARLGFSKLRILQSATFQLD